MERTLKLTIDTKQQRVLFAEADKPFVDFIFSFLITPMGGYNVGHLPTISQSVKNFKAEYMDSSSVKGFLTNPKSPFVSSLLPIPQPPCPLSSFTGANYCPHCSRQLYTPIPDYTLAAVGSKGFVKGGVVKYIVMDDLSVTHLDLSSSIINLLKKMNVNSLDAVEERVVHVTKDQAQLILKLALTSSSGTVLTNVFLGEEAGSNAKKRVKKESE